LLTVGGADFIKNAESLIVLIGPMEPMVTTTITVSDSLRAQLVKLAAELQLKVGKKVNYEDVIRYLISKNRKNAKLLREACAPVGAHLEEFRTELRKGRAEDRRMEETLEQRYS
jgi:predicted CopG family antitoxin